MSTGQAIKVAIIDFQAGNLRSCSKAFEHIAGSNRVDIVTRPEQLEQATHIVLPGQGAFGDCSSQLRKIDGMVETLSDLVLVKSRPFFGICVGMQLLADKGMEFGEHAGLGWIPGEVVAMQPDDRALKIPHMGWNDLQLTGQAARHPVLEGVASGDHAYFVHSYHFRQSSPDHLVASVDYGQPVTAIVARDNMIGTQFHPEKSQATGLQLIRNFLEWRP